MKSASEYSICFWALIIMSNLDHSVFWSGIWTAFAMTVGLAWWYEIRTAPKQYMFNRKDRMALETVLRYAKHRIVKHDNSGIKDSITQSEIDHLIAIVK